MVDLNKSAPPPLPSHHQADDEILLLDTPNSLHAMAGKEWVATTWQIFKERPLIWIGAFLLIMVISVVAVVIPVVGGLLSNIVSFIFYIGFIYMVHQQVTEGETAIEDLFIGFRHNFVKLLIFYICEMLVIIAIGVLAFFIVKMLSPSGKIEELSGIHTLLILIITNLLLLPVLFSMWFAPIFILFYDMNIRDAMKKSLIGIIKNLLPIMVYSLIMFGLSIIALLPLGLGLFVVIPITMMASYVIFREIFTEV